MRRVVLFAAILVVGVSGFAVAKGRGVLISKRPSSAGGQQVHTATWTKKAPAIDGVISRGEYRGAIPLKVNLDRPEQSPGIVPPPAGPRIQEVASRRDLSFTAYMTYDADNLYVAVDVTDDHVIGDSPGVTWQDDAVEVLIDGDNVDNDYAIDFFGANAEGFQLIADVSGETETYNSDPIDWEAAPATSRRGYAIEFRVSLSDIDTEDGAGVTPAGPGSVVGFNITVDDDDNGGRGYNVDGLVEPTDGYATWDGEFSNYLWRNEAHWGTLYLNPPKGKSDKKQKKGERDDDGDEDEHEDEDERRGNRKPAGGSAAPATWGEVKKGN